MVPFLLVLALFILPPAESSAQSLPPGFDANPLTVSHALNELPVSFRQNMGQWDEQILYQGFSPGWNANINFLKNGLSFGLKRTAKAPQINSADHHNGQYDITPMEHLVWNLYFKGMSPDVSITTEGEQESHVNYLIGNDASRFSSNVPDCRVINYTNVYDHVDIKYYSTGKNIKYDLILKPGADINAIQLGCEGIRNIRVNEKKQLEITNAWGTLVEEMPESYQVIDGKKIPVAVEYLALNDHTFGFKVRGNYDRSQTLIIDPVILAWSTFVGASGTDEGYCYAVAVDPAGNVYCTGFYEGNFPITPGAYDPTYQFQLDAFVFKLNPNATALIYATYLGGSNSDCGYGIAADASGEAFITGRTASSNFPTTGGSYQPAFAGGGGFDVFVTKLNPLGTNAVYSTYIGGIGDDEGYDIKINAAGEAFITGVGTTGYPITSGAFQTSLPANYGALVTKLNAAGSALLYSGLLGGSSGNYGYGIAIDPAGNAYVTGETGSWINSSPTYTDFPLTPGAFDMNFGQCGWKGFITKIDPSGTSIVYSSLLGGQGVCNQTGPDKGMAVAVNAAGEAFVAGVTTSSNLFTTPGAYDQSFNGGSDAFVIRLNAAGTNAIYCTFYGGSMGETVCGIVVNSSNEAFISGYTETDDGSFPVTSCAYQSQFGGQSTANIRGDIFVAKLNSAGTSLLYSTFMGGNSDDYQIPKIVLYGSCEEQVIVNGTSHSQNFPTTTGVFQPVKLNGGDDQPVVFKLKAKATANFTHTQPPCSMTVTFADSSFANCVWSSTPWTPTSWSWNFGDNTTSNLQNPVHTYSAYGTYNVTLVVGPCPIDSITIPITVSNTTGSASGNTSLCQGGSTTLSATGGTTYSWSTGATTSSITVTPTTSTTYSVVVSNGMCADTITIPVVVTPSPALTPTVAPVTCNGNNNGSAGITVTNGNSPYTYSWSNAQTTASISNLSPGNYTVIVTNAGGCTAQQVITITQPTAITASAASTNTNCGNSSGSATVTASGGTGILSYSWVPSGGTSATATGLAAGNYTCTITDANGCTLQQTVTINPSSGITLTANSNPDTCSNGIGMASANASGGTAPYSYTWSNGATTQSISNLTSGTYSVIVTDAAGCSQVQTVTIGSVGGATANAGADVTITQGDNTQLNASGGSTYSWSPANTLSCNTCSNPLASPAVTTTYVVVVTNASGCTDVDSVTVFVDLPPCNGKLLSTLMPNAFTPNHDGRNDELCIPSNTCIVNFHLAIFDRWGEKVFEADNDITHCWDGTYKGKELNTAVFVYVLEAELSTGEKMKFEGNVSLIR
jgi:gliding motility-associated-like protein